MSSDCETGTKPKQLQRQHVCHSTHKKMLITVNCNGSWERNKNWFPKILQTFIPKSWEPSVNSHVANNDPKSCNPRMKESLFSSQSVIFIVPPCARSQMHLFTNRNCYQTTTSNGSDIWRPISGIDVWCSRRVNLTLYDISLNMICCPPTRLISRLVTQI
jgi:hypothetical protein